VNKGTNIYQDIFYNECLNRFPIAANVDVEKAPEDILPMARLTRALKGTSPLTSFIHLMADLTSVPSLTGGLYGKLGRYF